MAKIRKEIWSTKWVRLQKAIGILIHSLLVKIWSRTATLEDWSTVSYTVKHILACDSAVLVLGYLTKWNENLFSQQNLYTNICSSFAYNHQRMETIQLSFQLWYIHTLKYYSTIKRNKLLMNTSIWMDLQVHHAKWRKSESNSKGCAIYDFLYPEGG